MTSFWVSLRGLWQASPEVSRGLEKVVAGGWQCDAEAPDAHTSFFPMPPPHAQDDVAAPARGLPFCPTDLTPPPNTHPAGHLSQKVGHRSIGTVDRVCGA